MRPGWREKATDVVRRHRPDYMIILYTGILMLLGLVVIYAIGPQRANVLNNAVGSNYSDTYFFIKQTTSLLLALGAFAVMASLPYSFVIKHGLKVLVIGLAACTLLAVASAAGWGIAANVNGATRWFDLGALGSLQPAEILKFGLLLYLAVFLGARVKEGKVNSLKETLIPVGFMTAISLLFIVEIQQDLGTGIALTAIVLTMLFVGGISKKVGLTILGVVLATGVVLIVSAPHRIDRVLTYLKGDNTSTDDAGSYHIQHAKIALGTGFLFGVGIGNSVQATGYLPEAINDSVFAIMGETFGFVGLLALMAVFVALLLRLLKVMDHLVDIRLKLLVAGVFGWFGAHVILNIAAMIGIFPLTGITLPLLSFGGTSMIFITAALGLVFQLSRYTIHSSRIKESSHENSGSGRRLGRTRYTSRSGS
ncbi:MAG: FtsW/RodA/SpoVE family cell cycle protein [Candidatus Microsaccharimonas sp.]